MLEDKSGVYEIFRNLQDSFKFAIADVNNSINNLKNRIKELEADSHIHIVDTAIHKGEKKSGK